MGIADGAALQEHAAGFEHHGPVGDRQGGCGVLLDQRQAEARFLRTWATENLFWITSPSGVKRISASGVWKRP
jgi:hypothetical protein